jgi:hypothetical protein
MTDDTAVPVPDAVPEPPSQPEYSATDAPTGPSAGEAWVDVVARLGDLGEAVSAWAKAAADNPDNRRHLDEVRAGVNDMAGKAEAAFAQVASSDIGQQVKAGATEAGEAIGDAAQKASAAAAPHVASAFAGLADVFGRAATKVDEAASRHGAASAEEPPKRPKPPSSVTESDEGGPTFGSESPTSDD